MAGIKFEAEGYGEFKKSLNDIKSSLKVVSSELRATKSEFDKNDRSVTALTAKNKALSKTIEEQKKYVDQLKQGVAAATKEWGENDKRTQELTIQYNNAKTALNKLTLEYEANAKAIDGVGDEAKGTAEQLKKASDSGLSFGDVLKANVIGDAIVSGVKALGSAIRDVAGGMKDAVVDGAAYADNIMTMSTVTGLSTDALQEYQYMAELTDTSVDTITGSLTKLTKNMETAKGGTGSASEAFKALGISITNSDGSLRSNQDVFAETIQALGGMTNETQRNAYSMEIFGKSAQDLNPLIAQGKDGIAAFAKEAHDMGYVLDTDALSSLGAVDDAMQRFNSTKTAIKNQIAEQLAPTITDISQKFQDWASNVDWESVGDTVQGMIDKVKELFGFIQENWEIIVSAIAAIATGMLAWNLASMISGVVGAIKAFQTANEGASVAQALLNGVMAANPFVLVATLVAALVAGIIVLWNTNEDFRNKVTEIWEAIKNVFVTAWEAITELWSGAGEFFSGVWEGITTAFSAVKEWFGEIFSGAFEGIKIIWNMVAPYFNAVWETIKGIFAVVKAVLSGDWQDAWNAIKGIVAVWADYFQGTWDDIKNVFNDAKEWGEKMITAVWDGMKSAWKSVVTWFNGVWNDLFGNRTANVTVNKKVTGTDGSHASGLNFVPFDGYVAELHKGEMVVPANLADGLRNLGVTAKKQTDLAGLMASSVNAMSMQGGNQRITVEIPLYVNGKEFYRASINDLWSVMSSNPRVVSDAI